MNTSKLTFSRFVILGAILLVLLGLIAFQMSGNNLGLAASSSSNNATVISVGQKAAIDGAAQLLLLQPQTSYTLFLPAITH